MPIAIGILILVIGAYIMVLRSQVDARTAERDQYKEQVKVAVDANEGIVLQCKAGLKVWEDATEVFIGEAKTAKDETAAKQKEVRANATKFVTEIERLKAEAKVPVAANLAQEQAAKTLLGLPTLRGR